MQQRRNVVATRAADQINNQRGIRLDQGAAARDRGVERQQPCGFVGQKSARIVVKDRVGTAGALAQFQKLVDLFLVFGDRDARCTVACVSHELVRRNIRKNRRRKRPQGHGGKRCGVKPGAIVAYHRQSLIGPEPERFERRRKGHHFGKYLGPASLLPYAAVALAKCGAAPGFGSIARQRRDQGRGPALLGHRPGGHERRAQRHIHHIASTRRAAAR